MSKSVHPVEQGFPIQAISLALTEDCSFRCTYCFCGDKYTNQMTPETARRAIDWLLDYRTSGNNKTVSIDFWGGEPMLRFKLMRELVAYGDEQAAKVGKTINWGMTTNGAHLSETVVKTLVDLKVSFMISFDGDRETHNRNRPLANGKGSYDVIVRNLPHVFRLRPQTRARLTVAYDTAHRFKENIVHLWDLGFRHLASSPAFEGDWTDDRIEAYKKSISELADWYIDAFRNNAGLGSLKMFDSGIRDLLTKGWFKEEAYTCGAGRSYIGIGVDGAIYPCHRFNDFDEKGFWWEKEWAIGHIDSGITKPEVREDHFLRPVDLKAASGKGSKGDGQTCAGCSAGCYLVNLQQTGDTHKFPRLQIEEQDHVFKESIRIYNTLTEERNQAFIRHLQGMLPNRNQRNAKQTLPDRITEDGFPVWGGRKSEAVPQRQSLEPAELSTLSDLAAEPPGPQVRVPLPIAEPKPAEPRAKNNASTSAASNSAQEGLASEIEILKFAYQMSEAKDDVIEGQLAVREALMAIIGELRSLRQEVAELRGKDTGESKQDSGCSCGGRCKK